MTDRNQWDEQRQNRSQASQQDWSNQQNRGRQDWQQPGQQHGQQQGQHRQGQDWGGRQQGAWHDDDYRRSGDYSGNEWRGERDWGSPGYGQGSGGGNQPQQREWRSSGQANTYSEDMAGSDYGRGTGREARNAGQGGDYRYAERAWGGSSQRNAGGARPGEPAGGAGYGFEHQGASDRYAGQRFAGQNYPGYSAQQARDIGARGNDDWYSRDTGRAGSQSFAAGYGMSSGANYDQSGGPQRYEVPYAGSSDPTFGRGYGPDYGRDESRGFFARAGDEIASWFGDDEAARRREQDYRGHGPSDYTRSDERIREDANDRLTDDPRVDARRISVSVKDGEVTLSGTVVSREAKRRAEDCVDRISGIKHVQNNLRVEDRAKSTDSWSGQSAAASSTGASGTSGTTGTAGAAGSSTTGAAGSGSGTGTGASTTPSASGTGSSTGSGSGSKQS